MDAMIQNTITTLNTAINALDYFEKQFELVERVRTGDKIYPAPYCTDGEYQPINFDNFNGVSYWRKTAPVSISEDDAEIACNDVLAFNYPLRLVGAIKKEKLSKDDAYSEERVIQTIISNVTGSNKVIKGLIKAKSVFIRPTSHDDDALRILQTEYSEVDNINYNFAYFRIDFDVIINIRENCIPNECE